jgi:threonine synthase
MQYRSTRGDSSTSYNFLDVLLLGLADDGGLMVPISIPTLSAAEWGQVMGFDKYTDICYLILRKFIDTDSISDADLARMINECYKTFSHSEIAPITRVGESVNSNVDEYLLELFHGPTFAFKDLALQLLGHLFEFALKKRNRQMTILGATSGDTGSAAIAGVVGREKINCFILYPLGKTSNVQELQMTQHNDGVNNIHALAVDGDSDFDDCQAIVKELFTDVEFKTKLSLGAVNSINWARIVSQIVYYASATASALKRSKSKIDKVVFSVPTGNFGDILAGYYAKRMGVPIDRLIVASNQNDILPKFFSSGKYHVAAKVIPTLSPSMDIGVSSNFERYLFYLFKEDFAEVRDKFNKLKLTKEFDISKEELEKANADFGSYRVSEAETVEIIRSTFQTNKVLLCPHTAVGFAAAQRFKGECMVDTNKHYILISLATAHVGKFSESLLDKFTDDAALSEALHSCVPKELRALQNPKRIVVGNNAASVREYLLKHSKIQ